MPDNLNRQLLPKDAVVDRFMHLVNGTGTPDRDRYGYMSRKRGENTVALFKGALAAPMELGVMANSLQKNISPNDMVGYDAMRKSLLDFNKWYDEAKASNDPEALSKSDDLRKSVTLSTNLVYYDLRAPALNLFPTVTPLRNSIPRNQRPNPGDAARWKAIDAVTGSGFPFMGWVPEGKRSASVSYTESDHTMTYKTLGEEDSITEEARFAAMGFEDEDALVQLRLLLKMFVKEEAAILAGNTSVTLSIPTTPVLTASGAAGTLPALTYSVIVVALTPEGLLNSSLAGGVATLLAITGNDGGSYNLSGGSSMKSAAQTQAVTLGQTLFCSTTAQQSAVAYAWFVGAAGAEKLEAITTINSAAFSAPLVGGARQAATAVTADNSKNATAFDGLLVTTFNASNAYLKALPTGVSGTGTFLTSSGQGSVTEVDTMLQNMWDVNRVSPTVVYVNSQELRNISAKVLNGSSAPLLRYSMEAASDGIPEYKITAAGVIAFYYNPYTPDGGVKMPIKVHPNMPAGTLFARAEILPPWYVSNNVPEVAVVQTRQDYYAEVWPKTTRVQFYGVYTQEVLAVYATFAAGIIYNIGNG